MIRVYADPVAYLFHYGHMEFLRKIRAFGDYLLVGIYADDVLESYKRRPILTMEERAASVAACRYVDEVLPNAPLVIYRAGIKGIKKYDIPPNPCYKVPDQIPLEPAEGTGSTLIP